MRSAFCVLLLLCAPLVVAQSKAGASSASKTQIARGKYLVQRVGMCGDCHTPRGPQGQPIPGRELAGAPLEFKPLMQMPWASTAPEIAGLPGWTDKEITNFLMTGTLNGKQALPPMPQYRLSSADAHAVVAYLRSLGRGGDKESKGQSASQ